MAMHNNYEVCKYVLNFQHTDDHTQVYQKRFTTQQETVECLKADKVHI